MSLYTDRIAQGLCGMCGAEDPRGKVCGSCKEKARVRAADKRAKNAATGCLGCGNPTNGGSRCEACKAAAKISRDKTTEKRKREGKCVACPNDAKLGCTLCQTCIDKRSAVSSEHYRRRKDAGSCRFCDSPPEVPGGSLCGYHRELYKEYRLETKLDAFDAYGGPVCCLCGEDRVELLEIDHTNGGGNKHRASLNMEGGGYSFYLWLKRNNYPPGFRVLCPTCNKQAYKVKTSEKVTASKP